MSHQSVELATRLTATQIEEEVQRILPVLLKKTEESRDILFFAFSGYSTHEVAHECKMEAKYVPGKVTLLFNTLNLPCTQESEDARLIIINALAIIDKEKGAAKPEPPKPAPPDTSLDSEILRASELISTLENEDITLLAEFYNGEELEWADFNALCVKLALDELKEKAARRALREAYELAGRPLPEPSVPPVEDTVPEPRDEEPVPQQEVPDALQVAADLIVHLSPEEFSVARYVANGCSTGEIASKMRCSSSVVKRAVRELRSALQVPDSLDHDSARAFIAEAYRLHYA